LAVTFEPEMLINQSIRLGL